MVEMCVAKYNLNRQQLDYSHVEKSHLQITASIVSNAIPPSVSCSTMSFSTSYMKAGSDPGVLAGTYSSLVFGESSSWSFLIPKSNIRRRLELACSIKKERAGKGFKTSLPGRTGSRRIDAGTLEVLAKISKTRTETVELDCGIVMSSGDMVERSESLTQIWDFVQSFYTGNQNFETT